MDLRRRDPERVHDTPAGNAGMRDGPSHPFLCVASPYS